MSLRGHVTWVVTIGIVAAITLPVLVFYTGQATLGPYVGGGLGDFVANYLADLARLRAGAWTLLLGPMAMVAVWRVLVALAWPRQPANGAAPPPTDSRTAPAGRRDPTIGGFSRE
jgi:hypothetical protein